MAIYGCIQQARSASPNEKPYAIFASPKPNVPPILVSVDESANVCGAEGTVISIIMPNFAAQTR